MAKSIENISTEFPNQKLVKCGKCAIDNEGSISVDFEFGIRWSITPNRNYKFQTDNFQKLNSLSEVPKYYICKKDCNVGGAFTRRYNSGRNFLLVKMTTYPNRLFYIFPVNDSHEIQNGSDIQCFGRRKIVAFVKKQQRALLKKSQGF